MATEIALRPWIPEDAISLAHFASHPDVTQFLMDSFPSPYTYEDAQSFIASCSSEIPALRLAISIDGNAVGGIGLYPQADISRYNLELAYWLGQPYWGKGIMVNAIRQMVDYGFRNTRATRIFARTFGGNIASQRVLIKSGFVQEARFYGTFCKNDVFDDELVFAIRRA